MVFQDDTNPRNYKLSLNTGFFFMLPTPSTRNFMLAAVKAEEAGDDATGEEGKAREKRSHQPSGSIRRVVEPHVECDRTL